MSERTRIEKEIPIGGIFPIYALIALLAIMTGLITSGRLSVVIAEALIYFGAFFIFFMIIDIFGEERCANIFMTGILISGFLVALYGVLLLIYGRSLLINYLTYNSRTYLALRHFIDWRRTLSSYGDPNTLGAQLIVFCSITTSLILQGKHNAMQKTFLSVALILTVVCIYFTSSRATLIGLFVLLLIFATTKVKKIWIYFPILAIGYLAFIEPVRRAYEHRIFTKAITTDVRITYIKTFLDILVRFPFGVGFGKTISQDYYSAKPADSVWDGFNSFYLHIFSRIGIQGLIVFGVMLFLIFKYLFKELNKIEDQNIRYFVFGGTCGLVAQQFNFITNNIYQVPGGMLNFWVMCGMLTAIVNLYKINGREKSG